MVNCSVKGCSSQSTKPKVDERLTKYNIFRNISFMSFPKEKKQRQQWIQILKNAGKHESWGEDKHLKFAKVCGLHFKAEEVITIRKGKNKRDHLLPTELLQVAENQKPSARKSRTSIQTHISVSMECTENEGSNVGVYNDVYNNTSPVYQPSATSPFYEITASINAPQAPVSNKVVKLPSNTTSFQDTTQRFYLEDESYFKDPEKILEELPTPNGFNYETAQFFPTSSPQKNIEDELKGFLTFSKSANVTRCNEFISPIYPAYDTSVTCSVVPATFAEQSEKPRQELMDQSQTFPTDNRSWCFELEDVFSDKDTNIANDDELINAIISMHDGDELPELQNLDELQPEHQQLCQQTSYSNSTLEISAFTSENTFNFTRLSSPNGCWSESQWANC